MRAFSLLGEGALKSQKGHHASHDLSLSAQIDSSHISFLPMFDKSLESLDLFPI